MDCKKEDKKIMQNYEFSTSWRWGVSIKNEISEENQLIVILGSKGQLVQNRH